jgi:hypothetical protein
MTTYDPATEARMLREERARRRAENPPHYVVEGTGARILRYSVYVSDDLLRVTPNIYGAGWLRMTLGGAHRCGARQLAKYLREREAREFREVV